jgi:hypothetical protein
VATFNWADKARLKTYRVRLRFRDIVTKAGADVLFANHTDFDGTKMKIPRCTAEAGESASARIGAMPFRDM